MICKYCEKTVYEEGLNNHLIFNCKIYGEGSKMKIKDLNEYCKETGRSINVHAGKFCGYNGEDE